MKVMLVTAVMQHLYPMSPRIKWTLQPSGRKSLVISLHEGVVNLASNFTRTAKECLRARMCWVPFVASEEFCWSFLVVGKDEALVLLRAPLGYKGRQATTMDRLIFGRQAEFDMATTVHNGKNPNLGTQVGSSAGQAQHRHET